MNPIQNLLDATRGDVVPVNRETLELWAKMLDGKGSKTAQPVVAESGPTLFRFSYLGKNRKELTHREVEVESVVETGEDIMFIGQCLLRGRERRFLLSRVQGYVEVTQENGVDYIFDPNNVTTKDEMMRVLEIGGRRPRVIL